MRARARITQLSLVLLLGTVVTVFACSSSAPNPNDHPPVVDCERPPIGSVSGPLCRGICLQLDVCDGAATVCPTGFVSEGTGSCPNQALCCVTLEDAGPDAADATITDSEPPRDAPLAD